MAADEKTFVVYMKDGTKHTVTARSYAATQLGLTEFHEFNDQGLDRVFFTLHTDKIDRVEREGSVETEEAPPFLIG